MGPTAPKFGEQTKRCDDLVTKDEGERSTRFPGFSPIHLLGENPENVFGERCNHHYDTCMLEQRNKS